MQIWKTLKMTFFLQTQKSQNWHFLCTPKKIWVSESPKSTPESPEPYFNFSSWILTSLLRFARSKSEAVKRSECLVNKCRFKLEALFALNSFPQLKHLATLLLVSVFSKTSKKTRAREWWRESRGNREIKK